MPPATGPSATVRFVGGRCWSRDRQRASLRGAIVRLFDESTHHFTSFRIAAGNEFGGRNCDMISTVGCSCSGLSRSRTVDPVRPAESAYAPTVLAGDVPVPPDDDSRTLKGKVRRSTGGFRVLPVAVGVCRTPRPVLRRRVVRFSGVPGRLRVTVPGSHPSLSWGAVPTRCSGTRRRRFRSRWVR